MTDDESALLADVTIDAPWALVEAFSKIVREHPRDCNRAADLLVKQLDGLGVPVTVHAPKLYLSLPGTASVEADGKTFRAKPAAFSNAVPDGIEAPLAWAGGDTEMPLGYGPNSAALFGEGFDPVPGAPDLKGKIALYPGMLNGIKIRQLQALGAVAAIAVNPGQEIHWGGLNPQWGAPDLDDLADRPNFIAASINNPDGMALKALAEAGGKARLKTTMEEGWYESKLPVVEIPGTEEPEKFVLLHGHYDAWDVGVGDNATGNAAMLEVARVLWKHRDKLKRSVRIAWWPGHSAGRFAGSTWYSDAFAVDIHENCVAQSNCDSPGCRWATVYENIAMMPENGPFTARAIEDVTGLPSVGMRPPPANDYSFTNLGVTGYYSSISRIPQEVRDAKGYYYVMGNGANIEWHTERDTLEVADREILVRDIRIYLLTVFRNANARLLPLDWRIPAEEFVATIDRYRKAAGDRIDLDPARQAAVALKDALPAFYKAAESGRIAPAEANAALLRLSRILVPLNYARKGHFSHDWGTHVPPLPDLAEARHLDRYPGDASGFAQYHLLRGRNRVVAALREATAVVQALTRPAARASAAE
ncbi:MAG: M28 family peptidase [Acetobacterales bacterium]